MANECLCNPNWNENLGTQEDCNTCDRAGNEPAFAIISRNNRTHTKYALVEGNADSGKLSDVVVASGEQGVNGFAKGGTVGFTSSETLNDNGQYDVSETYTMIARLSQQALNWIQQYKGTCVTIYWEDNCGKVWAADLELNDYTATIDADETGQRGVTINFVNTTEDPFAEVDTSTSISANYTTTDEFFDYITTVAA